MSTELHHLSDKVPNNAGPETPAFKGNPTNYTQQLYVFCKGDKEDSKHNFLDSTFLKYSQSKIKPSYCNKPILTVKDFCMAQYQPNVNSLHFHMLFSIFFKQGIVYWLATNFNRIGKSLSIHSSFLFAYLKFLIITNILLILFFF